MSSPAPPPPELYTGFGLAELKTEGAALPYDRAAGPGKPLTWWGRVKRRLEAIGSRLRYLPTRVWWAFFGGAYY